MSTELKELFDAARVAALPASSVDLDDVVRRGRRRRALLVARTSATVGVASVVVAAVGALAAGTFGGAPAVPVTAGDSGAATASDSPAATDATPTALPSPVPTASPSSKSEGLSLPPPDPQLQRVKLADPAPGFPIRRLPDAVALTGGLPGTNADRYVATFLVQDNDGRQATVMVGAFPMPATSGIPVIGASPGPITDRPTVLGYPAYVTSDGQQTILYFSTGTYTVMATGGVGVTADQLITLSYGLSGLS